LPASGPAPVAAPASSAIAPQQAAAKAHRQPRSSAPASHP
jgi:hypothetical protein